MTDQPPLNSLYQQLILQHYRHPKNKADLAEKTVEVRMLNPVCGDDITLQLHAALYPQIELDAKLRYVYAEIEIPLHEVLYDMERTILGEGSSLGLV